MKIARLSSCKNFVSKREKFICVVAGSRLTNQMAGNHNQSHVGRLVYKSDICNHETVLLQSSRAAGRVLASTSNSNNVPWF